VERARSGDGIELEMSGADAVAAVRVEDRRKEFIFVRGFPREQRFQTHAMPLWARAVLGVFTASVICLLFAHYVTAPLRMLRRATREFAEGNLQVRISGTKPFHRGDEFADLARDFDNMASHIQNLVLAQQRMLGDISHELRSPLTRLQVALEIARRKSGPEAEPPLNRIETEAERLNTLIGQILHAARVELAPGSKKLFDLAILVNEVAEDADYEASAHDRHVRVGANEMAVVHGNRDLVRSAIENVVRNAIRYTPQSTDVSIDLKRLNGSQAVVTVRDRGPGVPEDAIPHLFEPFYRVNAARDRDSGGAGLGLAITQHVVQAHGGSIRAANGAEGGLQVEIQLPLKVPEVANRRSIRFR
jgi:two-component system sensor histidine kinase CpxA